MTDRLFKSYGGFFRQGKGFPRLAKRILYSSFSYKLHENNCRVQLPEIGRVKYSKSQPVTGAVKAASVVKEADGWYVTLCCEVEITPLPPVEKVVGLTSFVVTSDGQVVENPSHTRTVGFVAGTTPACTCRTGSGLAPAGIPWTRM